ncbi:hypothetical protein ACVW0J_001409 [Bradyrhizobium sp. i1.7.7]
MHGEMAQMMIERLLFLVRLAPHGLVGDRDVAEHARRIAFLPLALRLERGKRQHVGRLVDAAPVAVERTDTGIIGQHHGHFGVGNVLVDTLGGGRHRTLDHRFGIGFALPAIGNDEDLGHGKVWM